MATITNFTIDQGTTFSSVIDIDNQEAGLFQLDSYTARGKIRKSRASQSYTLFSCAISENAPAQDSITISLTAEQTKRLSAGRYVYDIEIYTSTTPQNVIRILEGQIEVIESITQANPLGEGIEFEYTEENYVAHDMYHPTTGAKYTAATYADHVTYMGLGYVHVYPIGADNSNFNSSDAASSQSAQEQASSSTSSDASDTSDSSSTETQDSSGGASGYSY